MKKPKFTIEECVAKAQSYDILSVFREENQEMYRFIKKRGLCNNILGHMKKRSLLFTEEYCKDIIKKYSTLKEFRLNEKKVYAYIIRHKWNFLLKDLLPSETSYNRIIYAYEFPELNFAYIGLTWNIERRHNEHLKKGTLYDFCMKNNLTLSEPIIKEKNIPYYKAGNYENHYIQLYKADGWKLLNKIKAGSLGGDFSGGNKVAVFNTNGNFLELLKIKDASEKYNINRHNIRLVLRGTNHTSGNFIFMKEEDWIKKDKPLNIDGYVVKNKAEKIVHLDKDLKITNVSENKRKASEFEGYSINANNNLCNLKHNTIVNTKKGKCAYYDDYEKYINNELILYKPNMPKCKTLLLLPHNFTNEDVSLILQVPKWKKNNREYKKEKLKKSNKIDKRKREDYISPKSKEVLQFDFNGVLLNEYKSAKFAERDTNIKKDSITTCANGHSNTCGGYIWIYKKDYTSENLKKRLEKIVLFLKNKGSVINSQKRKKK